MTTKDIIVNIYEEEGTVTRVWEHGGWQPGAYSGWQHSQEESVYYNAWIEVPASREEAVAFLKGKYPYAEIDLLEW